MFFWHTVLSFTRMVMVLSGWMRDYFTMIVVVLLPALTTYMPGARA